MLVDAREATRIKLSARKAAAEAKRDAVESVHAAVAPKD
jgi:hypothetical protein